MAEAASCPNHPAEPASGACARCGAFFCHLDSRLLDGKLYCSTCAARPDVDWLEGFRLKHWGKRDLWAWMFGIGAPLQLASAIAMFLDQDARWLAPFVLASGVGGALWWLKVRAARWFQLGVLVAMGLYLAVTVQPAAFFGILFPFLILFSVATATTTKLWFELEVSRADLTRMWDLHANNQLARHALALGLMGLVIWPLAPFAVLCGAIGLARVDLEARPPVGRRKSAIAGIVLGLAGAGICAAMIFTGAFR
jgi:hypothetical protein